MRELAHRRAWLYAAALLALSAAVILPRLGESDLTNEESQYALVVQTILHTGDWIHLTPYPPDPYFQKPPLYMWLTALTYEWFTDLEVRFRVWSALCGIACVVLVCLMAQRRFSPEVGLLAGLILLGHNRFISNHGARSGTFDALLTALLLAATLLYLSQQRSRARGRGVVSWLGIGLLTGLACLTKPLAGLPLLLLLAIDAAIDRPRRLWWLDLLLATLVCLLVAAPWHLAQYLRFGHLFLDSFFASNLHQRMTAGLDPAHLRPPWFYPGAITFSSPAFRLALPALALCLWLGARRNHAALRALAIIAAGWLLLFSLSASKALHYLYPAFPAFALLLAGSLAWLISLTLPAVRRPAVASLALVLTIPIALRLLRPAAPTFYAPWRAYLPHDPSIRSGTMQLIFYRFPARPIEWRTHLGLTAQDCFYLQQMHAPQRISDPPNLAARLRTGTPALLVLPRREDDPALWTALGSAPRLIHAHNLFLIYAAGHNTPP